MVAARAIDILIADCANEFDAINVARIMRQKGIMSAENWRNWMNKTAEAVFKDETYNKRLVQYGFTLKRFKNVVFRTITQYIRRSKTEREMKNLGLFDIVDEGPNIVAL